MDGDSQRSRTAEGAAALRAAGARERDPALRNPDNLAEHLIGLRYRLGTRIPPMRAVLLWQIERRMPGLYSYVTARTKHLDELLLTETRSGAKQVVILGAGADSRAYRLSDALGDAQVFEVDHPATGAWKRERLRNLPDAHWDRVGFVAVDFGTGTLDDALADGGVDRAVPTVFLWEGVTPYLTSAEVDATLSAIARFATGSSVVFDYWYRDVFDRPCPYPEGEKFFRGLAARGEPARSGLDPATLADHLAERGLRLIDNAGPRELARHLPGARRPIMSFSAIAHARVP
ncbi:class I SAM-dependent methyltransferase [Nocardia iowensis]|uniref:S-adenosyl-L-methionine-dependent methyltransferase n=1 Tax=Nocardia iowensis TaxID=204891 RepID=A0ABX8RXJ8_NOCIO|nr:SAM-dependent methyltransferase [Nocardia iowensis]QXN92266.1 SAM-dependent methyltransferase [Nocardia iowensis]